METTSFTCPECGMVSHHPDDARHGYCGRCHAFVADAHEPEDRWWYARRDLPDGRILFVVAQIYNWKLTIGSDEMGWDDAFCYQTPGDAVAAMRTWDGDGDAPGPWIRNETTGRRRPDGDPAGEFVRW